VDVQFSYPVVAILATEHFTEQFFRLPGLPTQKSFDPKFNDNQADGKLTSSGKIPFVVSEFTPY
jgi:hypothetical protein